MYPFRTVGSAMRHILYAVFVCACLSAVARAQDAPQLPAGPPPAYLAAIEGTATIDREGESIPAELNMPFVPGDRLRTADGRVEIAFPDGTAIEVGENSVVECVSPTRVRLIAGTMDHLPRDRGASQSSQYLPPELNVYGSALDQNGTWQYEAPYGYVWYPSVAADWRPYYYGYWSQVPSYGYTWIGADVWSWPTHHYGRWGFARNHWYWIPGRTWGPAWVSWASAANYVSWCPLGFDGRPVFALNLGWGNPWLGWTVLSRPDFGTYRYYPYRYAIAPQRIPANTSFVVRNTAPLPPSRMGRNNPNGDRAVVGNAVPRQVAPPARQAPVAPRASTGQPAMTADPNAARTSEGRHIVPTPASQVPIHYGVAVPRTAPPPPAGARPIDPSTPASATTPTHQPPAAYRPPGQAVPRVGAPPAETRTAPAGARTPPAAPGPPPSAPPPPSASPRAAPAQAAPAQAAPAQGTPAQGAPAATPPHGRSAPQGGGEGRAQSRGRGR